MLFRSDCPQLAYLCEWGECIPEGDEDALAELEQELAGLADNPPEGMDADTLNTLQRLLTVVKARPAGALGLLITDGTKPEDDEE